MTPELKATIEEAYRIFSGYTVRRSLSVCHCNSCMSKETEHELLTTPLREIPYQLLAEYTNSAHDWDDGPVAHQMRYFLPISSSSPRTILRSQWTSTSVCAASRARAGVRNGPRRKRTSSTASSTRS